MPELLIEVVSTREEAVARIEEALCDVLVVDTFPRGLGGELASLLPRCAAKKILVHRDLASEYVAWGNLREFVASHYDCILCPGERGPFADLPQALLTAPWIARAPLAVSSAASVVVCASGNADEMPWYGEVAGLLAARDIDVRCLAPISPWNPHWPAIDWIACADVVVGGAGYNTVNECLATGTPLVARPWTRKYDRQRARAERSNGVMIVEAAAEAVDAVLHLLAQPRTSRPEFRNGAIEAAAHLR